MCPLLPMFSCFSRSFFKLLSWIKSKAYKNNQSDQSIANSFLSCPANSKCPRIVVSFCVFVKCCLFPKNLYYQYTSYTVVTSIVPDCTMQQVLTKWGPWPVQRGPNQIFWDSMIFLRQKQPTMQIWSLYDQKQKLKLWPLWGPGWPKGAPNPIFWDSAIFLHQKQYTMQIWSLYDQKQKT